MPGLRLYRWGGECGWEWHASRRRRRGGWDILGEAVPREGDGDVGLGHSILAIVPLPDRTFVTVELNGFPSGDIDGVVRRRDPHRPGKEPSAQVDDSRFGGWALGAMPDGRIVSAAEDTTIRLWEPLGDWSGR